MHFSNVAKNVKPKAWPKELKRRFHGDYDHNNHDLCLTPALVHTLFDLCVPESDMHFAMIISAW